MLDENKIIIMTRLAAYEKGAGKEYVRRGHFFRTDYISLQLIKSFICGTLAYLSIVVIIGFYNFELLMSDVYNTDLLEFAKKQGTNYCVLMAIYLVATYALALYRFNKAKRSLSAYNSYLNKLLKMNGEQE